MIEPSNRDGQKCSLCIGSAQSEGPSRLLRARDTRGHVRLRAALDARISTIDPYLRRDSRVKYFVVASAVTCDVADGGMRLAVDSEVEAGCRVVVELEFGNGTTVERNGRVVWSSIRADGTSELGLAFDEPLAGLALYAAKKQGERLQHSKA